MSMDTISHQHTSGPENKKQIASAAEFLNLEAEKASDNSLWNLADNLKKVVADHPELETTETQLSQRLRNFLRIADMVSQNSEQYFAESWFRVKHDDPNSSEQLRDAHELMNILGFEPQFGDNPDTLSYKSPFFPRMEMGEIYDKKNDQIIVIVGAKPE